MERPIVTVKNVRKYFGETKALDGISFDIKKGEIFGLLGPNGAGKTTIVKVLTTLLRPDSGTARVKGIDVIKNPEKTREVIGLAGQYAAVDEVLTGRQNLEMVGKLYHLQTSEVKKRVNEVLKQISLEDAADRSVRTYSGGMRRRLDLGASLMFTPDILFLDEPTTGLDPKTRRDLWQTIRDMVNQGVTLLLTTQYLEEADELADRIVVIDKGKVIAQGTARELKRQLRGDVLELEITNEKSLQKAKSCLEETFKTDVDIDKALKQLRVPVEKGVDDVKKALGALEKKNIRVLHLNLSQPSLDDVFLELTKEDQPNER